MRPFGDTISLDRARRALISQAVHPIARTERVPLLEAHGRVLAVDVVADVDVPPFSRAAMDGYAVRAADTVGADRQAPKSLVCLSRSSQARCQASRSARASVRKSPRAHRCRLGADAVVMVEQTDRTTKGTSACLRRYVLVRTSGNRERTSHVAIRCCVPALSSPQAASGRSRRLACPGSTPTRGRALRSSRQATKSSSQVHHSRRDIYTTSTSSRWRRWSKTTGACQCCTARRTTRSTSSHTRSTAASRTTCWCSRAVARLASAT